MREHCGSKAKTIAALTLALTKAQDKSRYEEDWRAFFTECWPLVQGGRHLVWNWHMDVIGEYLKAFRDREIRRLIINVPPRTTKSLSFSVVYPAWVWTKEPWHQFLSISNEEDLAVRDAVATRLIIVSEWYQSLWGHEVQIASDQNTKDHYKNTKNGHRLAEGLHSKITGKGGDTILIDDPHDSDKVLSDLVRQSDLDAYDHKVTSRMNDRSKSGIAIIMQRQHGKDLTGHILSKQDQHWETLILPMEYDGPRYVPINAKAADPRTEKGELLDPVRVPESEVKILKEDLGNRATGQLQQRPSEEGGNILKREEWRKWPDEKPLPLCEHLMQSYDTAFTEKDYERASYSARTTWGIFYNEETGRHEILLVEAWRDRVAYPDLRKKAKEDFVEMRPDRIIVEKKASGQSLIQDLRRSKLPVSVYTPDRDKITRASVSSAMLTAGRVWYPARKWAKAVIDECAGFPNEPHDDFVDTCTMAWLWLLRGWWVTLQTESEAEEEQFNRMKRARRAKRRSPYGGR